MAHTSTHDVDQLKARVETAKAALNAQLNALLHTEAWTQTLKSMAVLGRTSIARLSFRNLMLLVSQRPEIHHAATFQAWRALGRSVRKGEKALHVLKPRFAKRAAATQSGDEADKQLVGFSILPLFALEQTDGAPLEPVVVPRDFAEPAAFAHTVEQLLHASLDTTAVRTVTGYTNSLAVYCFSPPINRSRLVLVLLRDAHRHPASNVFPGGSWLESTWRSL